MIRFLATLALVVGTLLLSACTTQQSRYVLLDQSYGPLPSYFPVEVFRFGLPEKPFERVARLDVHLEKAYFLSSDFEDALPSLIEQARLSGSHAIIEIEERTSSVLETKIYHVTATGVRFLDE